MKQYQYIMKSFPLKRHTGKTTFVYVSPLDCYLGFYRQFPIFFGKILLKTLFLQLSRSSGIHMSVRHGFHKTGTYKFFFFFFLLIERALLK